MIIVRDVFQAYPDTVATAERVIRDLANAGAHAGMGPGRMLVDRTDTHVRRSAVEPRFVIEREFESVEVFKARQAAIHGDEAWSGAWRACKGLVSQARREILEVSTAPDD